MCPEGQGGGVRHWHWECPEQTFHKVQWSKGGATATAVPSDEWARAAAAARAHSMSQQGYNAAPTAESQHTPEASLFLQPATHPSVFQTQAAPPIAPRPHSCCFLAAPTFTGAAAAHYTSGPAHLANRPKYTPHVQADPTTHGYPLHTLDAVRTHGQPSAEAAASRANSVSQQGYNATSPHRFMSPNCPSRPIPFEGSGGEGHGWTGASGGG